MEPLQLCNYFEEVSLLIDIYSGPYPSFHGGFRQKYYRIRRISRISTQPIFHTSPAPLQVIYHKLSPRLNYSTSLKRCMSRMGNTMGGMACISNCRKICRIFQENSASLCRNVLIMSTTTKIEKINQKRGHQTYQ